MSLEAKSMLSGDEKTLHIALPKGHMKDNVLKLLSEAGIEVSGISERGYRPAVNLPNTTVKLLKPQNIVEMLNNGSRDIGFAGSDWVSNLGADVVELLDTGLDPVKIVAAAPDAEILQKAEQKTFTVRVASEYEKLTKDWIARKNIPNAVYIRTYGATESFPPEDAELIVDNTATGETLRANGLKILDTVMTSSTRLFASRKALEVPEKKKLIDEIVLLLRSVLNGRERVMVTFNIDRAGLDTVVGCVPCMRAPSVSELSGGAGYAVAVCAPKKSIAALLPQLKEKGATDIIVTNVRQIVA